MSASAGNGSTASFGNGPIPAKPLNRHCGSSNGWSSIVCLCRNPCATMPHLSRTHSAEREPISCVWRCLRAWLASNRNNVSAIERVLKKTDVSNRLPRSSGNRTSSCSGNTVISTCFVRHWKGNVSKRSCSTHCRDPIIGGSAWPGWCPRPYCRANRRYWCCRPCVRLRTWPKRCSRSACAVSRQPNHPMVRTAAISPF